MLLFLLYLLPLIPISLGNVFSVFGFMWFLLLSNWSRKTGKIKKKIVSFLFKIKKNVLSFGTEILGSYCTSFPFQ